MAEEKERSFFEKASPLFILLSIVLAFFVGTLWQKVRTLEKGNAERVQQGATSAPSQAENAKVSMDTIRGLFDKDVIKFGNKDSKLIFVEISDPNCPYCAVASGENPELNKTFREGRFKLVKDGGNYVSPVSEMRKFIDEGKASFIYVYYPGHGLDEMEAKVLYCAYEMDKFWPVHDLLMSSAGFDFLNKNEQVTEKKSDKFAQFFKSVVDPVKMKECLDSDRYKSRVQSDMDLAVSLGLQGTPMFFVNDTRFDGAYSFSDMEPVVKAALGE